MAATDLRTHLERLDGRGYPAYKELTGAHPVPGGTLFVDHVQGDPFAAPSKLRLRMAMEDAGLPAELFETRERRVALSDFLARAAAAALARAVGGGRGGGSGRSGEIRVDAGGQAVLERSAVVLDEGYVELRLEAGLPARGRRILGRAAARLLTETLPAGAQAGLRWDALDREAAHAFVACVENQEAIRRQLPERGLVAFVGDGSVLPRESGASDLPLIGPEVVPFRSPPELAVRLPVPNPHPPTGEREVQGMGVPAGVTLIVGGGYHGKSTLLHAIERGVYPHVPGDGRETVVSDPALVKVRAEDGRRVAAVDVHAFIDGLPGGRDTRAFSSEDASGSTSQAASIVEALEAGARGLLLDEDSCATNLMFRDARMQALIADEDEPITPLVDRVRELHELHGVSTVLVMGSSGDYFEAADRVIGMRAYRAADLSAAAQRIATSLQVVGSARSQGRAPLAWRSQRRPDPKTIDASRGRRPVKLDVRARDLAVYGRTELDLRALEQLVDPSQTRAVLCAIHLASSGRLPGLAHDASLAETLDALEEALDRDGLDVLDPFAGAGRRGAHPGNLARPRRFEIAAAWNRLRGVRFHSAAPC